MLELLDLSIKTGKKEYEERMGELQPRLFTLQRLAKTAGIPVIVVFEGWDAAGKGTAISTLVERLDPRGFKVHPIAAPGEEERLRPFLWRFWTKLPAKGDIAIFDRSWYGRVLVEKVEGMVTKRQVRETYQEIERFERQLVDDGAVIVKFWMHIDKKTQKKRFKECEKDPYRKWKIETEDWKHHKQYDEYLAAAEMMLQETSTAWAPWTLVESNDGRHARVEIFETLVRAIEYKFKQVRPDLLADLPQELQAPVPD